ncbi:DUF4421 family protein [Carboxylicivirga sp. RSCT41]|uniref:DUF4421 family protein n=1 Tax=Carboxylicivirga agarovorans TaxID=3417570 RepID=UPI003D33D480
MRRALLLIFLAVMALKAHSQIEEVKDTIIVNRFIDSLLIDRNKYNWSLRAFTNIREHRFFINDNNQSTKYIPNNPWGIGIGFASKKITLDVAFNIKTDKEDPTSKFNIKVSYQNKKHFVDFFLHRYEGFNIYSGSEDISIFNEDITSLSSGINYMYIINNRRFHDNAFRSVIAHQSETSYSFGIGGFGYLIRQSDLYVDAIPLNSMPIEDVKGSGGGLLAGASGLLSIGSGLYASLNLQGGAGFMYKKVTEQNEAAPESDNWLFQLRSHLNLAYVKDQYYINLNFNLRHYQTDLSAEATHKMYITDAKLVFGYKIFRKGM